MKDDITDTQDLNDLKEFMDTGRSIRLGIAVLIIGFGLMVAWSLFAPLDQGIPAQGTIVIHTHRKAIQHLTGGVIKKIHVYEGSLVNKGDLLIELEDANSLASYQNIRQNYYSLRATESRLIAELNHLDKIKFHGDLLAQRKDPLVANLMAIQMALLNSSRSAISNQLSGLQKMSQSKTQQLSLLDQQLTSITDLAKDGFATKNQVLQLQQSKADLESNLSEINANFSRLSQEYDKDLSTKLADVSREVQSGFEKLTAAREDLDRTRIKSPVQGQVISLAIGTIGGAISPGAKLMEIVPESEKLIVEVKIPPQLIDSIKPGLMTDVRFASFADSPQLSIEGKLISVSNDSISEPSPVGTVSFYLGRIEITEQGALELGNNKIQAGMPVETLIKTGERTLFQYLLHPLVKRIAISLNEK
jgi:protease secretion system membrane fusion protein